MLVGQVIPRATLESLVILILLLSVPPSFEARKGKKAKEADTEQQEKEKIWITGNTTHPGAISSDLSTTPVVKIGSFNLKQFGVKKCKNEEVLKIIAKIVSRYDLIALQEITDVKEASIKKLMGAISYESSNPYHYVVSPRVGRTKQKEQYGLLFRPDIFQVKRHIIFDDSSIGDAFSREPQIAEVILKRNGAKIVFINMHVAPKNASTEINYLTDVHTWVQDKWRIGNIVLLGDLNAACDYIRKKDVANIRLMNNPSKYKWLIPNNFDTTVGNTNCAYDRIIVSGSYLNRNVIRDSPGVFEFDKEFQLEQKAALNVSDHFPVEFSMHVEDSHADLNDEPPGIYSSSSKRSVTVSCLKVYSGATMLLFSELVLRFATLY